MPELPDVEVFKKYLESTALHKRIISVDIQHSRVLENIEPQELKTRLAGRSFTGTDRKGKYLFVSTVKGGTRLMEPPGKNRGEDEPPLWLVLHFGMTGYLKYFQEKEGMPEHTRVLFTFENNYHLSYVCQRLLGKVTFSSSPDEYSNEISLGIDASEITLDQFKGIFGSGRGTVKTLLMNQTIIAGLGNIYTDEILFQSGIHPKSGKNKLSDRDIERLYKKMKYVLETADGIQAKPEEFPSSFLIPRREEGEACPKCGGKIQKIRVSGRGTFFCSSCQKKHSG